MANTIGTAYIQIEPTTEGISSSISSALSADADSAGKSAGSKLSNALGTAAKTGIASVAALGTTIAGAGTAISATANDVASFGDNIDKASQKMGVSSSFYQEWDAVLQHSGTSMSDMTSTFKTLANVASDTTDSQAEALAKLGLSAEDLGGSSEQAFELIVSKLQGMEDGTERAAIAQDLLGKGATQMGALFNTSAEDTQAMIDTVNELGGVMSEDAVKGAAAYEDSMQDLQTAFTGIKNNAMGELLPSFSTILDGFTGLMSGSDDAEATLTEGITGLTQAISSALPTITTAFTTLLDAIVKIAPELLSTLGDAIISAIPTLIPILGQLLSTIANTIVSLLPMLAEVAVEIILELANGLAEALPDLIPTIVDVVLQIVDTLIDNVDLLVDAAIALMIGLAEGLVNALPKIIVKIPEIVLKIVAAFKRNAPKIAEAGKELIKILANGIGDNLKTILNKIAGWVSKIIGKFKEKFKAMADIGKNIVEGLWNGISDKLSWIKNKISSFCSSALDKIKDFFGIHSPSKVMADQVGKFLPEGIAVGIEANADSVTDSLHKISNLTTKAFNPTFSMPRVAFAGMDNGASASGNTYIINGITYDDGSNVSNAVSDLIRAARIERRA